MQNSSGIQRGETLAKMTGGGSGHMCGCGGGKMPWFLLIVGLVWAAKDMGMLTFLPAGLSMWAIFFMLLGVGFLAKKMM